MVAAPYNLARLAEALDALVVREPLTFDQQVSHYQFWALPWVRA